MKTIWLVLLLISPVLSWSADISVGGVAFTIPKPEGFSPVTPQMALLYELQKEFVAPSNEEFVSFIPDGLVQGVLKDEIPEIPRRFTVQTAKSFVGKAITTSQFLELKDAIKLQNDDIIRKVEALLPEIFDEMNESINGKYNSDFALSFTRMIPMPVHNESERTLSYSSFVKYDMADESGNPAPFVVAVTATFVHIKSKVLFLYSYAEETGLEWSRNASREWVEAVVLANPNDLRATAKEGLPPRVSGIDWGQVGTKAAKGAIVGLIIGLIMGLIGLLGNRGKKN